MKKIVSVIAVVLVLFTITTVCFSNFYLPEPEISRGLRGELGIDKNVNEKNIDKYLNREDSVYLDMRMLVDVAQYENIGGDSYLSGFVNGFDIIPYPYLAPTYDLPDEIGEAYSGETLFDINEEGKYIPNYEESLEILEYLFPKEKKIFLMCGGGGYANMTKKMLVALGWDESKIYNVGGYWYYQGENKVAVKNEDFGSVTYDFWKVPYHNIDFNLLHEVK